jgi:broad specificity phosphatase PhoE
MAKLVLAKHAPPEIAPEIPSARWVLSEEGRLRCDWLTDQLAAQGVSRLYSSLEPKTLETAALVAVRSGLVLEPRPNLHENDRTGLGFRNQDELHQCIREFFDQPDKLIIGKETATSALRRFTESINAILSEGHGRDVAIVTHGTVLSLFVAHHSAIGPFDLWMCLGFPSYVVLDTPAFSFDGAVHNYPD